MSNRKLAVAAMLAAAVTFAVAACGPKPEEAAPPAETTTEAAPPAGFEGRLLDGYDAAMRARRDNPFKAIADAVGWRALARPWAPAGLAAATVALGAFTGALTATGAAGVRDDEAMTYLSAALEPSFGLTEEALSWAEQ